MPIPEHVPWLLWRPVMAGMARLDEVRDRWTFAEIADAHALLDARELAEQREMERARAR